MAWFKKTRKPMAAAVKEKPSRVPEGLWVKCPGCAQVIYNKDLAANVSVCPKCGHHFRLTAAERLRMLFDGAWMEFDKDLVSTDPLVFTDTKPYKSRLQAGIESTGLKDAVIVASGAIDGIETMVASMEYGFIGGSMGVVVGEKITRGIERALEARCPVVIVCCSGGARMMEGALSLMQMAKICGALGRLDRARLPYISVLTNPTTGGVTASFAMLGDLGAPVAEEGGSVQPGWRSLCCRMDGAVLAGHLEYLFNLEQFGIKFGLENIRALVDELGRAGRAFRVVHIAGTNGKGSVTA